MSALLSQIPQWDDIPLVKLLDQPYAEALRRVYSYVAPLIGSRPLGAEEFTDHDLHHSSRIVQRIWQILPRKGAELNQPELYILLLSALLHDAGMWTTREEANELRADQEFKKYCSRHFEGKLDDVERELSSTGREWLGRLGLQLLAASYNRGKHAERLGTFVFSDNQLTTSPTGQTLRILVGSDFVEAVVAVSVAHSWDRKKVLEDESLRPCEFGGNGDLVDLRFLAILLRLGDLLDLGEGRISSLMWDYLRPLNSISEAHWRKERKLKINRCQVDLIEISGHFDIDSGGVNEREAYRLANDWLKWLEDEIQFVHHYERIMEPQLSKRLQIGALRFDKSRVTVKGLAAEGQVSFELDRQRIMRLLGDEIYSDGCVFVRELLQNAVDATRAQMVRDHKEQIDKHDPLFPPDNPWHWPHEVTERYTITVNTGKETIAEKEYLTFSIADPGVGMTLKQINNYFLQVGISYYKTDEFREEFTFPSISNFGIGFLSCLMVADKIEVITRPHHEPKGLRLSIQSPSDHFLVEKVEDRTNVTPGTLVKLWIDPEKPRAENWDSMPIGLYELYALGLSQAKKQQFDEAVKQWGIFLEFPMSINSTVFPQRRPIGFNLIAKTPFDDFSDDPFDLIFSKEKEEIHIQSVPVKILFHSKALIADGRLTFQTISHSSLPIMEIRDTTFNSLKYTVDFYISKCGFYLSSQHPGKILLLLNFYRLPPGALTAGRKLRYNIIFDEWIKNKVAENLIKEVMQQLATRSIEVSALWRLACTSDSMDNIPPLLLPCRTTSGLTWLTPQKALRKHKRLVLVPFGVAWHESSWIFQTPCLGIPYNDENETRRLSIKNELFTDNELNYCQLVSIEGICTGYLWPKDAKKNELSLVKAKSTFLKNGPVAISQHSHDHIAIDERLINSAEMPEYDRNGNPWRNFGLNNRNIYFNPKNDVERDAQKILCEIPPLSFENTEFEIILDDADDWE